MNLRTAAEHRFRAVALTSDLDRCEASAVSDRIPSPDDRINMKSFCLQEVDKSMGLVEGIAFRQATVDDAKTITRHRRSMFRDMGYRDEAALDSMMERFLPWVEVKVDLCEYLAWLALIKGEFLVAGAGLLRSLPNMARSIFTNPRRSKSNVELP